MTPPEFQVALDAARIGGDIVARYYEEGVTIRSKSAYNLVSDADIEAEHAIVQVIRDAFPEHAVMGEESYQADASAEHLWVIDPLDGTNNFAHGVPHFSISIAYYDSGQAQCGVIWNPISGDQFTVVRDQGAFHNQQRVQTGTQNSLADVLVGVGFYYDRGEMMEATLRAMRELFGAHIHGIRRFGTASLDLCQVALGRYGAYFEYELSPWDFAAGRLFVEEAGGVVTTCCGELLPLKRTSVLASNGHLHDAMLAIVGKHLPAARR